MQNVLSAISDTHSKNVHGRTENDRRTERRASNGRHRKDEIKKRAVKTMEERNK
jgi:hypothetical protein